MKSLFAGHGALKFCISLFCSLWVCCLSASAQRSDAGTILDRSIEQFRKAGGVKVGFSAHDYEGTASSGSICLKGEKFLLEMDGAITWFDGRTQWSYLASTDEVNISEPTAEELRSINPYALLSLYRQGYTSKLLKATDASLYEVELTATDSRQEPHSLILYISKNTYRPQRIILFQQGGKKAVIDIRSYVAGQNYPDAFFVFDRKAYPTAEIIDLR